MRKIFTFIVFFIPLMFCVCAHAEFTLPASLTSIGDDAFSGTAAQEIIIDHPVEKVGVGALSNMPNLHTVIIRTSDIFIHTPTSDSVFSRFPVNNTPSWSQDTNIQAIGVVSQSNQLELNKHPRLIPVTSFNLAQNAQTTYGHSLNEAALRAQTRVDLYPLEFVFP